MIYRLFVAAIFILSCLSTRGVAQRIIGADWQPPASTTHAHEQLERLQQAGISFLQVDQQLDSSTWKRIEQLGFSVYAMLPPRFPVAQSLVMDSTMQNHISQYLQHYNAHESVIAVGLFAYGAITDDAFHRLFSKYVSWVEQNYSGPLYYQTARLSAPGAISDHVDFEKILILDSHDIPADTTAGGYNYFPTDQHKWELKPVKQFLQQTQIHPNIPVFFSAKWLLAMFERHPAFAQTLYTYTTTEKPIMLASPVATTSEAANSGLVIALLLTWLILAFTCHYSPIYRKSFVRYFTGHQFYTKDVLERHVRTLAPGLSILAQHCVLTGILFHCLFYTAFSYLGQQALYTHYPFLSILGTGWIIPFLWGISTALIIHILSIGWFWLANPQITHLSQILNLYVWPLQVNIVVGTLISILFLSGVNSFVIYLIALLFGCIFAGAFIINAFKNGSKMGPKRLMYMGKTAGLYTFCLAAAIMWVVTSPTLLSIVSLASALP